ncbi:MAG: fatty acid oxidation complex subunit alpha FadB [Acidobacteriota bacterium]|nr:fatty acid oxidation complex subunit alpha FadB [Acidobacteriota bacterium]
MIYEGSNLHCRRIEGDYAELVLDRQDDKINKFDQHTLRQLGEAVHAIATEPGLRGLLITSNKDSFVVGADITEFLGMFTLDEGPFMEGLKAAHSVFNGLEDLDIPTVCAINGFALGGGLEIALACDFRVAGPKAKVGLPETKLGIIPGFGGTTRLPRMIGADNAAQWIAGAKEYKPEAAMKDGVVDAVVADDKLRDASLKLLKQAADGVFDWRARKEEKKGPLKLNMTEAMMSFETAKGMIKQKAGKHYPAPVKAVQVMQAACNKKRDEAQEVEMKGFYDMAKTDVAANLVGIFLNDQALKKISKEHGKDAKDVKVAGVLGAGIMGGGIAYQSASRGKTPVIMKDIVPEALQLGLGEASKLLGKLVKRGKIDAAAMATQLNMIAPTLSYNDMAGADIIIEAIVENEKIKKSVLAELETYTRDDAVIASNTSTISITLLSEALKKPERFVGMHFFNPVHKMPLVEVIRGEKTSDEAIATTVAYAQKMGKNPIVVNDCPGFLVNRILFPYFAGFGILLGKGADHVKVDKVMEGFGWPMGPAYLSDVVGIDTSYKAGQVMAAGFPDRLASLSDKTMIDIMYEKGRYGQKNDVGFYRYELDRKGRQKKIVDETTYDMIKEHAGGMNDFDDQTIIDHMMIPMIIEAARCLEDGIVSTPTEVDMGLVFGLGFPPFRGGAFKYVDAIGLDNFCESAEKYADYGNLYKPTERMKAMAASGEKYYKF